MDDLGVTKENKATITQIIGEKPWKDLNKAGYMIVPTALVQKLVALIEGNNSWRQ